MTDRGTFRLGSLVDSETGNRGTELAVNSSDLMTHGVIVGMTGSGKTGLGIVLLEEALAAGIPILALDPKGDIGNLALTFPELSPDSFRPWVSEAAAVAEGMTVDELATRTATQWREGLAADGIGPERVGALRAKAPVTIYTPGSQAGVPLNVFGSLKSPSLSWETESETLRDEIEATVTSLLGLVGITGSPLASREHVLLSNLVENAWRSGRDLDLGTLVGEVQTPPFRKLGVFELDAFFPQRDRTDLAFRLNTLLASPTFSDWSEGAALEPQTLLFSPDGGPRAAVVYLAHLSEEERQVIVTLVLSKLVTWMRGQAGAPDLRVLMYMDEVYGYVPPTAMPPAKKPMLTLLKQGRAFGVGVVLSTQNPVDLDYKAMANAGTWFVGRLQTENDKERVLEGLRPAAGSADVASLGAAIGGLQKRQFLLVSAKNALPRLFTTRWAMSYLRGPLTRDDVQRLTPDTDRVGSVATAAPVATETNLRTDEAPVAPVVAREVAVGYLDPSAPWAASVGATPGSRRFQASLAARVALRYDDAATGVDEHEEFEAIYGPISNGVPIDAETLVDYDDRDLRPDAPAGATYVLTPAPLDKPSFFSDAARQIEDRLVAARSLSLLRNRALKLVSRPGESGEQFAERCDTAAQVEADREAARIRDRLERKRERLERALATASRRAEELDTDARARQATEIVAGAGAVLGAVLGGRRSSRSIAGMLGGMTSRRGRSASTATRRETAAAKVRGAHEDLADLEQEILDEVAEIDARWRETGSTIEEITIGLEASDVRVVDVRLVWIPVP